MKLVILYEMRNPDLVMLPDFVADDLVKYQKKFDKLTYRTKFGCGRDAFIKWLNEEIIEDENEKAAIIKRSIWQYDEKLELPKAHF